VGMPRAAQTAGPLSTVPAGGWSRTWVWYQQHEFGEGEAAGRAGRAVAGAVRWAS
jgi:hypothetical protein